MNILYGITCVIGIITMSVFVFIGIWLFITALKAYKQLKYKNYILEKIYQKIDRNDVKTNEKMNIGGNDKKNQASMAEKMME